MASMNTPLRTASISREIDIDQRTVALACSSEEPYRRWWGVEILDHSPGSVDLTRLGDNRHPLLLQHDMDEQIGVVRDVTIGADKVLRCKPKFSKSAEAEEIFQDIVDEIRSLVSIGYMIDELQEERTLEDGTTEVVRTLSFADFQAEMRALHGDAFDFNRAADAASANSSDQPVFRVTRWTPYEVSIVSVPADATVGVGRAAGAVGGTASSTKDQAIEAPIPSLPNEEKIMSEIVVGEDLAAKEKVRVAEIRAVAQSFAKYNVAEDALKAIAEGSSVAEFQRGIMDKIASAHTADTGTANDLGMSKKEQQRYSVLRAIRALVDKDWSQAGFERECHEAVMKRAGLDHSRNGGFYVPAEIQKRDLTALTDSAGGYTVGTDLLPGSFIDLLRNRSVLSALGATFLTGLKGDVAIPKQTAAATAYWLTNEATAITESQQTFGQLPLTPKNIGAYTELSRQLMMQSTPAADALVFNDLAKQLALGIDLAGLEGSGASGQPTGISNTAGIGSVTGTTLAYAGMLEFQTDVAGSNALAGNCAYVTTPSVAAVLAQRARFSNTDTPLWKGNILDAEDVCGYRGMATNSVTAASMVFGDFSQVVIGEWGMLELALNPYANFTAAITGIRAIQSVDVGIRYAGAFSRATSIT